MRIKREIGCSAGGCPSPSNCWIYTYPPLPPGAALPFVAVTATHTTDGGSTVRRARHAHTSFQFHALRTCLQSPRLALSCLRPPTHCFLLLLFLLLLLLVRPPAEPFASSSS